MTNLKTTALLAAIIAGIGLSATAQGFPMRGAAPDMPEFAELDSNGDGSLTADELAAPAAAHFAAADTDGDGLLSPEELAVSIMQRRAAQMVACFDTDGDGMLSAAEMPGPDERAMTRLDRDGDGVISEEEFAAMGAHRGGRMADHRDRGDRDCDGHGGGQGQRHRH